VPAVAWLPARLVLGIRKPKKPILGVELAGEVEGVGKDVKLFKKGDKIFAETLSNFGAYAEYTCLPEDGLIAHKPDSVEYGEAAAIPVGARTALHYLKKGKVQAGQKVLIYGASGSVGTYAVQLAKHFGAEVTGICSAANLELVRSLGADKVVDYTDGDFTQKLEQYDMIFLAVDKWPFSEGIPFLREEGVYINITNPLKTLPMLWTSLTTRKKILVGESPPGSPDELKYLMELVETGVLKPVIDRTYPLKEIVEAHRYVEKGHKKGNVVIRVV
jgi:NADPH:quinone reductase-like Zn-dependent oxidoreductase